jgi:hypothetical protein
MLRKHGGESPSPSEEVFGTAVCNLANASDRLTLGPAPALLRRHEALQILVEVLDDNLWRRAVRTDRIEYQEPLNADGDVRIPGAV